MTLRNKDRFRAKPIELGASLQPENWANDGLTSLGTQRCWENSPPQERPRRGRIARENLDAMLPGSWLRSMLGVQISPRKTWHQPRDAKTWFWPSRNTHKALVHWASSQSQLLHKVEKTLEDAHARLITSLQLLDTWLETIQKSCWWINKMKR